MKIRTRLSLLSRMLFAVGVISSISVVLLVLGVIVGGTGTLATAMILGGWIYTGDGFVWQLLWAHRTGVVVLGGTVTFAGVIVPVAIRELRTFRQQLLGETTQARDAHKTVDALASRLAQKADVPHPDVRVKWDSNPRSYALGSAKNGTLVVTTALVTTLSSAELEAVLAHELSHLLNRDSRIMEAVLVPVLIAEDVDTTVRRAYRLLRGFTKSIVTIVAFFGSVVFVAVFGVLGLVVVTAGLDRLLFYLILGGVVLTLPRWLLWLCKYAAAVLSRGREFAADDGAVALTGNPAALASALQQLTESRRPETDKRQWVQAGSALNILPTVETFVSGPLRTHPKTERRIRRLEKHVERLESNEA